MAMTGENHAANLPDTVSEQAIYWFALLLDGSETEEDRRAFARWLDADPAHLEAFGDIERLWSGSTSLNLSTDNKVGRRAFMTGTAAAVVIGAGWVFAPHHPFADIRTATGERHRFSLPGDVEAELASDTVMSYVARDGVNGVELHRGEAWFNHLATGSDFFVAATNGTSWSRGGRLDVAVYDGDVTVIAEQNPLTVRLGSAQTQLAAGNAVRYSDLQIGRPYEVDISTELAWRNGQLVFMGQPLGEVVRVLQRWQNGKIMIIGEELKSRPVTLVVDLERSKDVLPVLASVLSISVHRFTDYLTVIRAA
ncbi:MAG: iron dicitrate transport regulator FecR [Thalassospira sp.]|uniref:FecR family protein n=1 Tax=Thalassospira sp. TaxID=1912094 RepID=UPI000C48C29C|nr:DUF4880 domain-containing protein [Thalassospira sp.]MAZ35255.1 iron dicitrate transport regulator FecR [Thalassospira sp.]